MLNPSSPHNENSPRKLTQPPPVAVGAARVSEGSCSNQITSNNASQSQHDMFACSGTIADEQFKQIGRDFYGFHKAFSKKRVQFAFSRADFCEVAQSLGITTKTAERYITELCKNGQLEHPAHGQYYKPDKNR